MVSQQHESYGTIPSPQTQHQVPDDMSGTHFGDSGTHFGDSGIHFGDLEARLPLPSKTTLHRSQEDCGHEDCGQEDCGQEASSSVSDQMPMRPSERRRSRRCFKLNAKIVADAILGISDGLTVPFALTAGLATVGNTRLVILGGLAELIAGAISMGLGGYVGAKSEIESYQSTERECDALITNAPDEASRLLLACLEQLSLPYKDAVRVSDDIQKSGVSMKQFLLRNHFDVTKPDKKRPYISALTLGVSYFAGGFIPLIPYFIVPGNKVLLGLWWSIGIMVIVLLIFGYVKTAVIRGWSGRQNVKAGLWGAVQMLMVGAVATGAAVGLVLAVDQAKAGSESLVQS